MKTRYKSLLMVIIGISLVSASLFAAHIPPLWWAFSASVFVMAAALAALRALTKEALQDTDKQQNPLKRFSELLKQEILAIDSILLRTENSSEWLEKLEQNQEHFYIKVEVVRPGLVDLLGMKKYIAIITPFALAERHLNRGLSSAMDGYFEESRNALKDGREHLNQTINALQNGGAQ